MTRSKPNILITGTPGVGKSTLCTEVIKQVNLEWIEISKVAKARDCLSGYDDQLNCPIIDEDKVIDELDPIVEEGGKIIEYHSCDFFPERWFDSVFVLRTNNTVLYDRLQERLMKEYNRELHFRNHHCSNPKVYIFGTGGYNDLKIRKNIECEIFQSILEEAMNSYNATIVQELHNNNANDIENNINIIVNWVNKWIQKAEKSKNKMFESAKNT